MPDLSLGVNTAMPTFQDSIVNSGPSNGNFGTFGLYAQALGAASAGLGDILSASRQATALKTQSYLAESQARENTSRVAVQQRQIGIQRDNQLLDSAIQYHALQGLQTAAYASQNVRVNSGVAAETSFTQGQMGVLNALTLKNNAVLQAWGVQTQTNEAVDQQMMQSLGYKAEAAQEPWLGFEQAANQAVTIAEESERTKAMFGSR